MYMEFQREGSHCLCQGMLATCIHMGHATCTCPGFAPSFIWHFALNFSCMSMISLDIVYTIRTLYTSTTTCICFCVLTKSLALHPWVSSSLETKYQGNNFKLWIRMLVTWGYHLPIWRSAKLLFMKWELESHVHMYNDSLLSYFLICHSISIYMYLFTCTS